MLNIILVLNIILLIIINPSVASLVGSCNQCFTSNKIACLDETHFATCFQGTPTAVVTKCPPNRFCTDDVLICHSTEEGYSPVCYHDNYCGDCEITNGIFTCLDETTYGYCFGGKTPLEGSSRSCPKGFVCNYNFKEVCVPEDTHKPSCTSKTSTESTTTESTTTESTTPESTTTESTTPETTTTESPTTESTTPESTTTESTTTASPTTESTTTDSTTTESTTPETTTTEFTIIETSTTDQTTSTEMTTETTTEETSTIPTTPTIPTTTTQETTETTTETSTTTEKTIPITTTTPKPRDADTICGEIGKTGYFKTDDPTCREYVYCYLLSGQYLGWVYYCDGYFNVATQKCQKSRPTDCIPY